MAKAKRSRKLRKPKSEIDLNAALDALGPVAAYPAGRIAWWRDRVAILDRHRRRSRMSDVEALQERNWPSVEISVDDPEATRKVRRNLTRVRQSEAWRHNRLTSMQRDAEREVEFAWRHRTAGLGAATSKYGILPGGGGARTDLGAEIDTVWREWHREAGRRGINQRVVIDVFSEPWTLAQIERDRRLRRGHAFAIYTRGLDLWAELRGWMRRSATIGLEARA
jgi:hypothetical protein